MPRTGQTVNRQLYTTIAACPGNENNFAATKEAIATQILNLASIYKQSENVGALADAQTLAQVQQYFTGSSSVTNINTVNLGQTLLDTNCNTYLTQSDGLVQSSNLGHTPNGPVYIPTLIKQGLSQAKRKLELEPEIIQQGFQTPKSCKRRGRPPNSTSPRTAKSPLEKTRYDTSLGLLTKKFVGLLQSSPDGVLDLNRAAEHLDVQKRRIYDITNVLEGISLIQKKSKNNIQWKGPSQSIAANRSKEQTSDKLGADLLRLRAETSDLESKENQLDTVINRCTKQLKLMTDDVNSSKLAYVTYKDIRSITSFEEQTVIAVKAPPDTRLEVPDPKEVIQIWLKSQAGPIEVYLCPEESNDTTAPRTDSATYSAGDDPASTASNYASSNTEDECSSEGFKATTLKYALLDEQDIGPDIADSILAQTEDQHVDGLVQLEPPISVEDYMFSLEEGEGISDLFDAYDLKF